MQTSIFDYLLTCVVNGVLFAALYMKDSHHLYPYVLDCLVLLVARTLTYPVETLVHSSFFSVFIPSVYFIFQFALDVIFLYTGELKFKSQPWLIFKITLFSLCFVGLPGLFHFLCYMTYSYCIYRFFKQHVIIPTERSFIGSWLLIPVPLFMVLFIYVPLIAILFTVMYKTKTMMTIVEENSDEDNNVNNNTDEEEQKTSENQQLEESAFVQGKRGFNVWRNYQKITQQMPLNTDESYLKTKEFKEKFEKFENGSIREQTKPSPYDYTGEKKVTFGTLTV